MESSIFWGYAARHRCFETKGTEACIKAFGWFPPEARVPHPVMKHLELLDKGTSHSSLPRQTSPIPLPSLAGCASLRRAMSLDKRIGLF